MADERCKSAGRILATAMIGLFWLLSLGGLWVQASEGHASDPHIIVTNEMSDLADLAIEKSRQYGVDEVLVVFDIDNTILAMNQALGSDQWFSWQNGLLNAPEQRDKQLMVSDFGELLAYQREFFFVSAMHPPEADTPATLNDLQENGFACIALTSRGPDTRVATERELGRHGMSFSESAIGSDRCGEYLPSADALEAIFSTEELDAYHLINPNREVSYASGIYMTSGLHKGAMLLLLLDEFDQHYRAVVFVDDHARHCKNIWVALDRAFNRNTDPHDDVDVTTCHYTREKPNVDAFHSKKGYRRVTRDFKRYLKTKRRLFPTSPAMD